VIAGTARGRRLEVAGETRPTSDRAKEALFSMLGSVEGTRVLDCFAGSGALAIEALSRGAASAVLVERAGAAVAAIRSNLDRVELADRADVRRADIRALLRRPDGTADLVFVDPPYSWEEEKVAALLDQLAESSWCAPGARVVLERPRRRPPVALPGGWESSRRRTYGDTLVAVIHT
jgi:16S rRNA (guanine966-N2)-methyltransferase